MTQIILIYFAQWSGKELSLDAFIDLMRWNGIQNPAQETHVWPTKAIPLHKRIVNSVRELPSLGMLRAQYHTMLLQAHWCGVLGLFSRRSRSRRGRHWIGIQAHDPTRKISGHQSEVEHPRILPLNERKKMHQVLPSVSFRWR